MKVLVLSPKPPWPPHDGGAVATMRCIEGLAAGGALITLLTMRTEKHEPNHDTSGQPPDCLQRYEAVTVDTKIRPVKMLTNFFLSGEPYDLLRFNSAEYSGALNSLLIREQFDIIQCEGLLFSYYVDDIRSVTSSPIVLRAHNVEHRIREMMAERASNVFVKHYMWSLTRRIRKREILAARQFDAVVPISEPDYQWFKSVSPGTPMILSETGTSVYVPDSGGEGTDLKVGFIGALNWQPNIEGLKWFLNSVWPSVLKVLPDVTLHIAGRSAPSNVMGWLRGKNIFIDGEVDDALRFMRSMTVMIAPLFAGSGLRIKIIEAMSLGKTVVATPVAASGLPVENRRELLIEGNELSFCNALTSALCDPGLRAATGARASELVKDRFDNLKQTSQLLSFYKNLCDGR